MERVPHFSFLLNFLLPYTKHQKGSVWQGGYMQNAKVREYMNYPYIWSGVWVLWRLSNLESFILIIKPSGMLRVSLHMVEEMGESWQELSLPTQFNWLRWGNFAGKVCWQICRSQLAPLCLAARESCWKRINSQRMRLSPPLKLVKANDLPGTNPFTLVNMQQISRKGETCVSPPAAIQIPGGPRLTNRCLLSLHGRKKHPKKTKKTEVWG